jgi:RNA polymerase sigma-70 factor (ECF subfamily)
MNAASDANEFPDLLLARAREGDGTALGQLLELYRNYLRILARTQVEGTLRGQLDPSDLVQRTFLEACRDFPQFAGKTERELMAWLRRILVHNLADEIKRIHAKGHNWQRQESLEALLDRSSAEAEEALAQSVSTPSAQASRREQAMLLANALTLLPPDYREVIYLRNLKRLPFEVIAGQMKRSSGAVRMLWARALEKLSQLMQPPSSG